MKQHIIRVFLTAQERDVAAVRAMVNGERDIMRYVARSRYHGEFLFYVESNTIGFAVPGLDEPDKSRGRSNHGANNRHVCASRSKT